MKAIPLFLLAMYWVCGCSSSKPDMASSHLQPQSGEPPPFVFVRGEFRNPGRYAWTNGMTLDDAFVAAGGFTDFALLRVRVLHWDGSSETYRWGTQHPLTNNPALKPGDSVLNPRD